MRPARHLGVAAAALVLGMLAAALPTATAQAAVAPWTWKRVTNTVSVAPTTTYSVRAQCPAGYTAISGGLQLPALSRLVRQGHYRQDVGGTSGWSEIFRNTSGSSGTATVVAECVETVDLPPMSYQIAEFAADGNGSASGTVSCQNEGEVVLTGGVDWSGGTTGRFITSSIPDFGGVAWFGQGRNVSGTSLAVEVYCAPAQYVSGFQRIELSTTGSGAREETATCPLGKRVLTGGTTNTHNSSYPMLNSWTSSWSYSISLTQTIRVLCVNSGTPTVAITFASPGSPGATTSLSTANFQMSGSDPVGFPNSFRCSLDGGAATTCLSGVLYGQLSSGPHTFVTWNNTADGRLSGVATYSWTVDRTSPTVTTPTLPRTTLSGAAKATWTGSDAISGVDYYQAAYRILGTDGAASAWTSPAGWASLTSPTVQTPTIARGQSLCVSVRAVDNMGNLSAWSPASCTTRPFDDRDMTTSTGWTRETNSAYWLSTATSTTTSARTLTRTNVSLSRVGIVATRCSGCGTVAVSVGGVQIGQVNLDATSTANRRVILLPAFTQSTGTVTVRSVTSGKRITIDGLVAIQQNSSPATL